MRYRYKGKPLNYRDPRADREDANLTDKESDLKTSYYGRKEYRDEMKRKNNSSRWSHIPAGALRDMINSLTIIRI